ncbi:hypothetical protein LGH70_09210 [Hymenobacter sp. BT635]|uniref:DUF4625 domain-containing protein n=1 Tax=Hymenobacter nitidus TaxID=2880929 RepID=A0ABS8ABF5_9BACT|nr:hypothetical protein [Hymenobacter nitidus]MCB2377758.1 hypothetical protein [Hymenobacter nitidus]
MNAYIISICTSVIITLTLTSCSKKNICKSEGKYIKHVDLNKAHLIPSTYCIEGYSHHKSVNKGFIKLNIYDRTTGNQINESVAWLNNQKIHIEKGAAEKEVESGSYELDVSALSTSSLSIKIKNIDIPKGKSVTVNVFLGSSLQF